MRFGGWWIAALAGWWFAAPAQAAWYHVRTPHFIVYSQGGPDSIRRFVTDLERFDQAARKLLGYADREGDDPNPVTIFVVDNVDAVVALCKGGKPKNKAGRDRANRACKFIAGFYSGRAEGSVAFVPRSTGSTSPLALSAQTILFHEYAHHLMMANSLAVYPAWYVEGFAEFLSNAKLDKAGEVGIGIPALNRAYSLLRERAIPVREMLTVNPSTLSPNDRTIFYGRAWLLTHFLSLGPRPGKQLGDYLTAINKGQSSAEAAAAVFGDLDVLNTEVERYLKQKRLSYLPVKVADVAPERIRIRLLEPGEAALMPIRLQSKRSVDEDSAPVVAAEARRLAAASPDDPGAQVVLAEAEYDAGYDDAAEAAADRALAVSPDNITAMVYKALATMRRAELQNRTDDATWRAARAWLLKANKLENDAAWPLILFYKSFLQQGKTPSSNAVAALERGFVLAPQDNGVRMLVVSQLLRDKRVDEARSVLTPLALHPHAPADNAARRLLNRINDRGVDALSGWNIPEIDIEPAELPPEEPAPKKEK